jgi:predicted Na+-dependent transporter
MIGVVAVAVVLAVLFAVAWGSASEEVRGLILIVAGVVTVIVYAAGYVLVRRLHWR